MLCLTLNDANSGADGLAAWPVGSYEGIGWHSPKWGETLLFPTATAVIRQ